MLFMNEYDVADEQARFSTDPATPNLADAADTLAALVEWANGNSDGWIYWPKPCRAAARLQELLWSKMNDAREDGTVWRNGALVELTDATPTELTAAYRPIKAFLTRQGVNRSEVFQ